MEKQSKAAELAVPRESAEITASWLSTILNVPQSEMKEFQISPNSFSGSGNLSDIVRVQFHKDGKQFHYIVKLLPLHTDAGILGVFYADKFDQKEVFFYNDLLPELLQGVPQLSKYICPFVYAQIQEADEAKKRLYGSVIVLEDLSPLNYYMPSFDVGLSPCQIDEAIGFAVELNVAGQLLINRRRGVSLPDIYERLQDWHIPCESGHVFEKFKTLAWFPTGIQVFDDVLSANSNSTAEMRLAFRQLLPFAEKIVYSVLKEGQRYPSIIHDDLWPHNFLIPSAPELRIKVIDWQMVGYTDPAYDLAHLLLSCLPLPDLNAEKLKQLVTKYYNEKAALCAQLELEVRRTAEEFQQCFFTYGISYALMWFAMSCDSIFANPKYFPKLYRIIELLYELKAPEFIMTLVSHVTK